ncbi:histidinol-phosphatase [Aestuariivivens sediminicola]|uniref:histidinol-phosphatase n=1 Tax=Aestuariivivens sediminicola TaxID=2913560 RepID=UPI001F59270D|nr:histidinol-phosphatase [Aestuariivivens sediminicola]
MKFHTLTLLTLLLFFSCKQEQSIAKQWYKGNLHTHSYWSDGDEFPEPIMQWYKSHDYQFVALTDHNTLAEGEFWKVIRSDSIYQNGFENYLNTYGDQWVNYTTDSLDNISVKLKTFEEYRPLFEENGRFLILQSEEISDGFNNKPIHLNATNIQKKIDPQGGESVSEVLQNNIDAVQKQSDQFNIPMMTVINHPNFGFALDLDDLIPLRNGIFFELFNGHPAVHNAGDSLHLSTERLWDLVNIAHIKANKPLLYGLATDDSHNYHMQGKKWSNAGRGWIEVRATALNPEALIEAMKAGDFYATTGIELKTLNFADNTLSIEVDEEEGHTYQISFIGCKQGKTEPEVLMTMSGASAQMKVTDELLYVRCKIVSSKLHDNPIEDIIYEMAWTQPVLFGH